MPKYWGKQVFAHARSPEVGQKQKTGKKEEEKKKEEQKLVITMARYALQTPHRVANVKPPGPKPNIETTRRFCVDQYALSVKQINHDNCLSFS